MAVLENARREGHLISLTGEKGLKEDLLISPTEAKGRKGVMEEVNPKGKGVQIVHQVKDVLTKATNPFVQISPNAISMLQEKNAVAALEEAVLPGKNAAEDSGRIHAEEVMVKDLRSARGTVKRAIPFTATKRNLRSRNPGRNHPKTMA